MLRNRVFNHFLIPKKQISGQYYEDYPVFKKILFFPEVKDQVHNTNDPCNDNCDINRV